MDTLDRPSPSTARTLALPLLTCWALLSACSPEFDGSVLNGASDTSSEPGDGDPGDGDGDPGDGDGDPSPPINETCDLQCGMGGACVLAADGEQYCACPEGTTWNETSCDPCLAIDAADYDIEIPIIEYSGQFTLAGEAPPTSEYDDANIWLENTRTGDRVFVGNTHDLEFSVRVTPGVYELVYEVETAGARMPHNPRVELRKLGLFSPRAQNIDIPVARLGGQFSLDEQTPPAVEYDDANVFLRDVHTGSETLVGNTHEGSYDVTVVPGSYEVVYRVETAGQLVPRNDGGVIATVELQPEDELSAEIAIASVRMQGSYTIAGAPAPSVEYDDANILLESEDAGTVLVGNTHEGSYDVPVLAGTYTLVYMHESGPNVPQNQRARVMELEVTADDPPPSSIDIPMIELSGALTLNGAEPPANEFDDGVVYLGGVDSDDAVILGNTHDGAYQVNVIPGSYDVYYAQETAGGTVPENKRALVLASVDALDVLDVNIEAVAISGSLTLGGAPPPSSVYEDGRLYLRNTETGDALLLGSTHGGSYEAVVVPGSYELYYAQEAGGDVPSNQNASLGAVEIAAPMTLDVDVPVIELSGQFFVNGDQPPDSALDGGQLVLRALGGDSALIGDSFAPSYATKLVAGAYGVYYRAEGSMTMPQNNNGRFACVEISR